MSVATRTLTTSVVQNPIPLHDARNGGTNALIKNLGDWNFAEVTAAVGLDENNTRWSMAASWETYDSDGDLDLYVANDYGRNNLYRCDKGTDGMIRFRDVAEALGVEENMTTSMACHGGIQTAMVFLNVYVSNMYHHPQDARIASRRTSSDQSPGSATSTSMAGVGRRWGIHCFNWIRLGSLAM